MKSTSSHLLRASSPRLPPVTEPRIRDSEWPDIPDYISEHASSENVELLRFNAVSKPLQASQSRCFDARAEARRGTQRSLLWEGVGQKETGWRPLRCRSDGTEDESGCAEGSEEDKLGKSMRFVFHVCRPLRGRCGLIGRRRRQGFGGDGAESLQFCVFVGDVSLTEDDALSIRSRPRQGHEQRESICLFDPTGGSSIDDSKEKINNMGKSRVR